MNEGAPKRSCPKGSWVSKNVRMVWGEWLGGPDGFFVKIGMEKFFAKIFRQIFFGLKMTAGKFPTRWWWKKFEKNSFQVVRRWNRVKWEFAIFVWGGARSEGGEGTTAIRRGIQRGTRIVQNFSNSVVSFSRKVRKTIFGRISSLFSMAKKNPS